MHVPHLFHSGDLTTGIILPLSSQTSQHLVKVLRWPEAAPFRVFNGEGGEYAAKIVRIEKKHTFIEIGDFFSEDKQSPLNLHLFQAVSRGEKMDFTIQKAVELGLTTLTPLLTERCNVKLDADRWEKKIGHWQAVAIAACEQSGRNRLLNINKPLNFNDGIRLATADCKLMLDPQSELKIGQMAEAPISIDLLVGSEGGFSEHEINLAKKTGFKTILLGPRILRTETAAIATIAALQSIYGDLR